MKIPQKSDNWETKNSCSLFFFFGGGWQFPQVRVVVIWDQSKRKNINFLCRGGSKYYKWYERREPEKYRI